MVAGGGPNRIEVAMLGADRRSHFFTFLQSSRIACDVDIMMMMTSNNKLLLNYLGDAVIYSSDLAILESPTAWLNSDIIHFWFLRLKNGGGESDDDDDAGNLQVDCLLLDPAVISFIMHQLDETDEDYEDEVSNLMSTWNLEQQQRRFFLPINDEYGSSSMRYTQGQQQASGSHWSLLLVDIVMSAAAPPVDTTQQRNNVTMPEIKFYHCDSHRGYNQFAAQAVANEVKRVFLKHYSTGDDSTNTTNVNVTECQVPQQSNGFDCGLYTLGFAEALLRLSNDNPCGSSRNSNDGLLKVSIETATASYISDIMGGQINFASNLRKRIRDDIHKACS